MIKTRLGLFSGVFLIVVGTAHSWPQRAAAVCIPDAGEKCFRGFLNVPIGGATLTINEFDQLVVTGLTPPNRSTAVATDCLPLPDKGSKIEFNDDAKKAGDKGFITDKDITIGNPNHKPPPDSTAYFVTLEEYWGISCTDPMWVTAEIPIGFRYSNGSITACADFDEDPIRCSTVKVQFKDGSQEGTIECPAGTLFTVPAAVTDPLMTLTKVKTHKLGPGQGSCNAEIVARKKATLEFVFANEVSDIEKGTNCTQIEPDPMTPVMFSASRILIKPKMDADKDCLETCSCAERAIDDPLSRGGNTPPIRRMLFLSEFDSTVSNRALVPASFIITNEAIGSDIPTIGTWGLVVMVQLVLVAGTFVFRRRLPMISAIGYGC